MEDLDDGFDSLEDLYNDAQLAAAARNKRQPKGIDPALKNALDAESKRLRELYTNPENWEQTHPIALIDKASKAFVGVFIEWKHRTVANTRKLVRTHDMTTFTGVEEVEGYLGAEMEMRIRYRNWDAEHHITSDIVLDDLMLGSPAVQLRVLTHLGATVKVELLLDTPLASMSGNTLLQLPAGTDIFHQLSTDTKIAIRKALP